MHWLLKDNPTALNKGRLLPQGYSNMYVSLLHALVLNSDSDVRYKKLPVRCILFLGDGAGIQDTDSASLNVFSFFFSFSLLKTTLCSLHPLRLQVSESQLCLLQSEQRATLSIRRPSIQLREHSTGKTKTKKHLEY